MTFIRRQFLHLAAGAAALPAAAALSAADGAYPTRPVQVIAGFPPGSAPDIVARLTAEWLTERLGQQFIVENRPGAGGNLAAERVVRASPDGYAILAEVLSNVLNASLYHNLNFDFVHDIAPVTSVANAPFVVLVTNSLPVKGLADFISFAKANPGKINMASSGVGSATHIFGLLFMQMAGVDVVHVPYHTNYMGDLISGQVQMVINPTPQSMEFVRAGKVRALGVTTGRRLEQLPELPAVAEFVPGYEAIGWYGIGAPKGTPADIVRKLDTALAAALTEPGPKMRLAELGIEPMRMSPAEFAAFIRQEDEKWGKVIRAADLRLE